MLCVWVHGCDAGRVSSGLSAGTIPSFLYRVPFICLFLACAFCYCSFLFVVFCSVFVLFFVLILLLELRRCFSDIFLSSRSRTGLANACITGYG